MKRSPHGLLNVLKPPGMTSHDVVAFVRRLVSGKVGHTGTLDPMAAGVLVLTVGGATRLSDLLTVDDKSYRAEFVFGLETDTLDLEGEVTARRSAAHITVEQVVSASRALTGEIEMMPPMFSAVKQGGRKLYELARQGRSVDRKTRRVTIHRFEVLEFSPGDEARCVCEIECSKGTYIRSLAEMLGEKLDCGACLGFLLRTAQGRHRVEHTATLEDVAQLAQGDELGVVLVGLADALPEMPRISIDEAQARRIRNGGAAQLDTDLPPGTLVMVMETGDSVCLAEVRAEAGGTILQPRRVFSQ